MDETAIVVNPVFDATEIVGTERVGPELEFVPNGLARVDDCDMTGKDETDTPVKEVDASEASKDCVPDTPDASKDPRLDVGISEVD